MVERISATTRPMSIPERQNPPGPVMRGPLDPDSRYPVGPLPPAAVAPAGPPLDGPDSRPLAHSGLEALAAALAEVPAAGEPSAMQPNQLFLSRQMVWQAPDAGTMAASWQIMVRTYAEQRAAWLEQARGQHVPSSLFMADHTPSALREGRPGLPLVTEMEPWRFAVFAWGAERLVLKVVMKDDEEAERPPRKRARVALRLELMLPGLGRVVIQMEPAAGNGVLLELGAGHTSAMQHLRGIMPQLAALVDRCGLTILRCRLRRDVPHAAGEHSYPSAGHTALLSAALFKSMAEIAVLLSQPDAPHPAGG